MELANYLIFNGNCEAAFKQYEKLLGGKTEFLMRFGEAPEGCGDTSAEWRDKVMHVRMTVGKWALMGSDAPAGRYQKPQGNWVSLSVDSAADAERIYKDLSDNATIMMALDKTFWAEKFAMLIDRYGTPWMINFEGKK